VEFIPFTNFDVIEKIGEGGFSKVFKAKWTNGGIIDSWSHVNQLWHRKSPPLFVALKTCDSWEIFINEVGSILMLSKSWLFYFN
jgi:serine/threonine protein kinase